MKLEGWVPMPKGPKGEKRKADVVGNAVLIAQIATGEKLTHYHTT